MNPGGVMKAPNRPWYVWVVCFLLVCATVGLAPEASASGPAPDAAAADGPSRWEVSPDRDCIDATGGGNSYTFTFNESKHPYCAAQAQSYHSHFVFVAADLVCDEEPMRQDSPSPVFTVTFPHNGYWQVDAAGIDAKDPDWINDSWGHVYLGPDDGTGQPVEDCPPPPDRDHDGVKDAEDRCPDDPGPAETQGCPDNQFVALGDSFSSGEGAHDYQPGTDVPRNRCHRSVHAYSYVLAGTLIKKYPKYRFRACSGATTEDFSGPNDAEHGGEAAQVTYLNPGVRLLTMSMGGNDVGFAPVVKACVLRRKNDPSCQATSGAAVDRDIKNLWGKLSTVYDAIRDEAPNAIVLIMGYPQFFPDAPPKTCASGALWKQLDASDMRWLNAEAAKLDATVAAQAKAHGFVYVDTLHAFRGHEICTKTPYYNKVVLGTPSAMKGGFHPNASGQAALEKLFAAAYATAKPPTPPGDGK